MACGKNAACADSTGECVTVPSITSFASSADRVGHGKEVTLSWTVSGGDELSISPSIGAVTGTSTSVAPVETTDYVLTATNEAGSVERTLTVYVVSQGDVDWVQQITTASVAHSVVVDTAGSRLLTAGGTYLAEHSIDSGQSTNHIDLTPVMQSTGGASAVALDAEQNVVVTGTELTTNFFDIITLKFGSDLSGPTIRRLAPAGAGSYDFGYDLVVDSSNRTVVVGSTGADLGDNTSHGLIDGYIARYNSTFSTSPTIVQVGTAGNDELRGVVTDSDGNIFVAGSTEGDLGGAGANQGGVDAFIARFDGSNLGAAPTVTHLGSTSDDFASALAMDTEGNLILAGRTSGSLAPEHGDGGTPGTENVFVAKYSFNNSFKREWVHQFGSSRDDAANGVDVDSEGNVVVVGMTQGALFSVSNKGGDVFAVLLSSDGQSNLWEKQLSSAADDAPDVAYGVEADRRGNVFVVGSSFGLLQDEEGGPESAFVLRIR